MNFEVVENKSQGRKVILWSIFGGIFGIVVVSILFLIMVPWLLRSPFGETILFSVVFGSQSTLMILMGALTIFLMVGLLILMGLPPERRKRIKIFVVGLLVVLTCTIFGELYFHSFDMIDSPSVFLMMAGGIQVIIDFSITACILLLLLQLVLGYMKNKLSVNIILTVWALVVTFSIGFLLLYYYGIPNFLQGVV